MNNKMITIPYADAIEYGENTSALFKALWELTDLIRLESDLSASDYDQSSRGYDRLLLQC